MEPFIGQVILFGGNFAPVGWAFCNGQLMSIAQYSPLFSILGTTYGGDGIQTFALPDLRGRAPLHVGASPGPGQPAYSLGEMSGSETVTLVQQQMPQHSHAVAAAVSSEGSSTNQPNGNIFGSGPFYQAAGNADGALGGINSSVAGSNMPHNNLQPFTAMNYIIALEGVYPPRS
jgi:microcystin-dependent protein